MRQLFLSMMVVGMAAAGASPAFAQLGEGGDCETSPSGCGGGGGPVPNPTLPLQLASKSGDYRVATGAGADYRDGYLRNDETTYFGGGAYHPIGGDGTLTVGITQSTVTLQGKVTPEATAFASASAEQGYSAQGGILAGYLVELHAVNAAAFATLQPLLNTSGAVAHISGTYTLAQSGQSFSIASAYTGMNVPMAQELQRSFGVICDRSGYYSLTGTECGTFGYALDLNFVPGSAYSDGNPLSVYGSISVGATVHAGATGISGYAGLATAFVDPTITLSGGLDPNLYTLRIGNAITPGGGAVPEPAAWALMLAGFGAIGSASRRTRRVLA
jgi:hypothetical protein